MNSQLEAWTSSPDTKPSRACEVLETLLFIVVLAAAFLTSTRAWYRMHWPFQMDYAEGTILNSAWRLAQGGALYPPPSGMPYQIDPYPPFIYHLVGFAMKHEGIDFSAPVSLCIRGGRHRLSAGDNVDPSLGRPLEAGFDVWLASAHDRGGTGMAGGGPIRFRRRCVNDGGVGYICSVSKIPAIIPSFIRDCRRRPLHPCGRSLLMLSIFVDPAREENSIVLGACFAALLISGFLYAQHASSGLIVYHLFRTQHSPYSLSQLASFGQMFLRGYALLFLLSAAIVWKAIREKRMISSLFTRRRATSLSLGKIGAAQNHILQLVFAICITSAVAYDWIRRNSPQDWGLALVLSSLILITMTNVPLRPKKPIEELSGCGEAYAAVHSDLGDRIFSDNVGGADPCRQACLCF